MTGSASGSGYDPLPSVGGTTSSDPEPTIRMASPVTGEEELAVIAEVLASGVLTNGPWTRRFESAMAERHGTVEAVAFANGTVALSAMYLAAGIGSGDEVIVPSFTFISTATSVLHVGATPVFADVDPRTFNLDLDDVARRLTSRTRAIVPVHYAGQPADMDRFRTLADDAGVVLLEDAAQAHGATFGRRPAGSWGDAAMFSFTPTKNITTGEGAVVTTDRADLARAMRLLRNHGMSARYHHEVLGHNWRLTEMQAAMGCVQLDRLTGILQAKVANARALTASLDRIDGVVTPVEAPGRTHPFMIYSALVPADRRDRIVDGLAGDGIESRCYFPPAHAQPVFRSAGPVELPVTDDLAARVISLPIHTRLDADDLATVADRLRTHLVGANPAVSG